MNKKKSKDVNSLQPAHRTPFSRAPGSARLELMHRGRWNELHLSSDLDVNPQVNPSPKDVLENKSKRLSQKTPWSAERVNQWGK